jgi:hypothetical protein
MRESYGEGLATHISPESCVVIREDAGEALTGGSAGRVLSRENCSPLRKRWASRVLTLWLEAEGHTLRVAMARRDGTRRGPRPRACMDTPHAGTGRSHACLLVSSLTDRTGKSQDRGR